jgi:putative chitobiose transport system permease protein
MAKIGKKRKRKLNRTWYGNSAIFLMLGMIGAFMALPLVYSVIQAFKPAEELFLFPPRFFVRRPTFENFGVVIQLTQIMWVPFSRYVFNSLFVSVLGTFVYIIIASLTAYPLAKHNFPGKTVMGAIIIWSLLFRPEVTGIPQYLVIAKLGLINSYWAILLPAFAGTFGVFLMRQFIVASIPDDTLESAKIDGAGEIRIYWSVVMPSVKPAWLTLLIFTFQGFWNATGIQYIYDENLKMLPTVLQQMAAGGIARAGAGAAVSLLLMIPPIALFIVSQSSILETMSHSGLK